MNLGHIESTVLGKVAMRPNPESCDIARLNRHAILTLDVILKLPNNRTPNGPSGQVEGVVEIFLFGQLVDMCCNNLAAKQMVFVKALPAAFHDATRKACGDGSEDVDDRDLVATRVVFL